MDSFIKAFYNFIKGRKQKYIRRIPTGNPLRPWRYIYDDEKDAEGKGLQTFENKKGLNGEDAAGRFHAGIENLFSFFGVSHITDSVNTSLSSMAGISPRARDKLSAILTSHTGEYQQPGTPSVTLGVMKDHMLEYFTNKSAWDKFFKAKEEKKAQALAAAPQATATSEATPRQPRQARENSNKQATESQSTQPENEAQTIRYQDRAYRMSIMKFLYNKYKGQTSSTIPTATQNQSTAIESPQPASSQDTSSVPAFINSLVGHEFNTSGFRRRLIMRIEPVSNNKFKVVTDTPAGIDSMLLEYTLNAEDFEKFKTGDFRPIGGSASNDPIESSSSEQVASATVSNANQSVYSAIINKQFRANEGHGGTYKIISINASEVEANEHHVKLQNIHNSEDSQIYILDDLEIRQIAAGNFAVVGGVGIDAGDFRSIGGTRNNPPIESNPSESSANNTDQAQVAQQPATYNIHPLIIKNLFNQKSEEEKMQALIGAGGILWRYRNMRRIYLDRDDHDLARGQKFYYNLVTKQFEGKDLSENKISELAHKIRSQIVGSNSQIETPNNFDTMPESESTGDGQPASAAIPSAGNQLDSGRVERLGESFGNIISRMPLDTNLNGVAFEDVSFRAPKFGLLNALKEPLQAVRYTPQQQRRLDRLEDNNDTGKMVLVMAEIAGNEKAIALAKYINKEHFRVGHLTAELNYARSMLLLRLQGYEIPNTLLPESLRGNTTPIQATSTVTTSQPVTELPNPVEQDESDPVTKSLDKPSKAKAVKAVKDSIKMMFDRLQSYQTTTFAVKLRENNITLESLQSGISDKTNVRDILKQLHENLKAVDNAHAGLGTPSYDWARNEGSYANAIYNETLKSLVNGDLLPEGYDQKIRRTEANRTGSMEIPPARELAERARRAAAEVIQQNAELMTAHAENLSFAQEYFNKSLSLQDKVKLAKGMNKAFGKDFSLKKWVESVQHPDPRLNTKLNLKIEDLISAGGSPNAATQIPFSYTLTEKETGKQITGGNITRDIVRKDDGSIMISHDVFPRIKPEFDEKYRNVASSIYSGTEKLLRDCTANLPERAKKNSFIDIHSCANDGFSENGYAGAVVWAKNYYDFKDVESESSLWKENYKSLLNSNFNKLGLTPAELNELKARIDTFTYPHQFMNLGYPLKQADCVRAGGINSDIKRVIRDKGGYDLGAWLMLKSERWWHAVNYVNGSNDPIRDTRAKELTKTRDKARIQRANQSAERARLARLATKEAANPSTTPRQSTSQTVTPERTQTPTTPTTPTTPRTPRAIPTSGLSNSTRATMKIGSGEYRRAVEGESFPSGLFLYRERNKWVISHEMSGERLFKVKNRALAQAAIVRLSTKEWRKSEVGVLASKAHKILIRDTIAQIERNPNQFLQEVMPSIHAIQEAGRRARVRR